MSFSASGYTSGTSSSGSGRGSACPNNPTRVDVWNYMNQLPFRNPITQEELSKKNLQRYCDSDDEDDDDEMEIDDVEMSADEVGMSSATSVASSSSADMSEADDDDDEFVSMDPPILPLLI